ncbi:M91 family zinc metallopeptidase [Kitasatospora sp. NPDC101183]|uniref:M91 family zinc metallopeptidase n=1 Tax=Kitasatospora sp. NPDC101183 TaxID=3364100 RepID=UPI00382F5102
MVQRAGQGHRSGPVTGAGAAPVQRMMARFRVQNQVRGFRGRLAAIRSTHQEPERAQEAADAWGGALDTLEHEVYAWFTANANANDEARNLMAAVMDEIQQEHHRYIAFVVENALQPFMTGLADDDAEANARMTWTRLSTNTGISVTDLGEGGHPTTPEFRTSVHSMNARLMSRPMGRGLLQGLVGGNAGAPGVSISAIDSGRLARVGAALGMAPGTYHDDAQVGPVDDSLGRALLQNGGLVPGTPEASTMSLEQNYHDSVPGRGDQVTGRRPQDPVTPAFITYGHELTHALHNQRGLGLTHALGAGVEELETVGLDSGRPEATSFLINQLGENYTTENDLRDEHGLPRRTSY